MPTKSKSKKRVHTPAYIKRYNKVAALGAHLHERDPRLARVVMALGTATPARRKRALAKARCGASKNVRAFVKLLEMAVAS